jgi:hypothetical protein
MVLGLCDLWDLACLLAVRETATSWSGIEEEGVEVGILSSGSSCSDTEAPEGNVFCHLLFFSKQDHGCIDCGE